MDHQDWEPVILKKNKVPMSSAEAKKNPTCPTLKTTPANKQTLGTKQPTRLADADISDPDFVPKPTKTYDAEFRKKLQQARATSKLSQQQLAAKVNVKPILIQEMENGKGEWDGRLVSNIEKQLKIPLGSLKK